MNTTKVRQLINQEISDHRTLIGGESAPKQYAAAYWQIGKLNQLGILHLMPALFGHSDADIIIKDATRSKKAIMTSSGVCRFISAHPLYLAINDEEATQPSRKAVMGRAR